MSHDDPNHHRRRRSRRSIALAALATSALLVSACSRGDDDTAATTVPTTTTATTTTTTATTTTAAPSTTSAPTTTQAATTTSSTSTSTTTTTLPPIPRQPLTGTVLADSAEIVNRPALVVKIDNAPGARRNHRGLARADLVFEEIVEGSITRFAAVFHSDGSDPVGPIRSGRSQDVDMLTSLRQPLFAWSGGNPGVSRLIADSSLVDLNWQSHGGAYYRGPGNIPHNLYSSTDRLWGLTPADTPGAPPQQFEYLRPEETFEGEAVAGADMAMRGIDVTWSWDAASGSFLRSQEGGAHIDVLNGQIGATNLVLMVVEYKPSQIDARSPEAQTIGNGPLWVLSDGKAVAGRWFRESADDPFQLLGPDGEQIALTPGNTWIELLEALPSDDIAHPESTVRIRPA